MKLKMLALLGFTLLVAYGCRKVIEREPAPVRLSSVADYSDWPTVENGMLVFRDSEHLNGYFDYLDGAIAVEDSTLRDDTTFISDKDDILESIENRYTGFTSLRSVAYAAFMQLNETGWADADDIPEIHYILDISWRSILSQNLEVRVGDDIIHYVNEEYLVIYPAGNADLRNDINALNESATAADIALTANGDAFGSRDIMILAKNGVESDYAAKAATTAHEVMMHNITVPDPCNSPKKVKIGQIYLREQDQLTLVSSYIKGDFTIDWGDGGPHTTHTSQYIHGPNNELENIEHIYANFGEYDITVTALPLNAASSVTPAVETKPDVKVMSCFWGQNKKSLKVTGYVVINGTPKVAYQGQSEVIQIEKYGQLINRIVSYTDAFEIKSNGNWNKKKGFDPSVDLWCDIYNNNCVYQYQKVAHDYPGGTSSASVNTGIGQKFGWTSLQSIHRVKYGENTYYHFTVNYGPCN